MLLQDFNRDDLRYERKYLSEDLSFDEAELFIKMHPAGFREIYKGRYINNIYYDSPGLNAFYDNVEGNKERIKLRVRWYGDLFGDIQNANFEYKIKEGLLGTKNTYPAPAFLLKENTDVQRLFEGSREEQLPPQLKEDLKTLNPVIINRYHRKYFRSFDKRFRVTIDRKLSFFLPTDTEKKAGFTPYRNDNATIVELKYGAMNDDDARPLSTSFPFRMTKSSKYVMGMSALQTELF